MGARAEEETNVARRNSPCRVLVRLLFVENQFVFPTPVVSRNQFPSRVLSLVQQISQQRVFLVMANALRIVQRVLDHTYHDTVAVLLAVVRTGVDFRQIRAVESMLDRFENHALGKAGQHMHALETTLFQRL